MQEIIRFIVCWFYSSFSFFFGGGGGGGKLHTLLMFPSEGHQSFELKPQILANLHLQFCVRNSREFVTKRGHKANSSLVIHSKARILSLQL